MDGRMKAIAKEIACWALAFFAVLLCCVLAVCTALACIADGGAYKKLARDGAYEDSIVQSVNNSLETAALDTGLPYSLLKEHVPDETVRALAQSSLEELPPLLSGKAQAYSGIYDAGLLFAGMEQYYAEQTGAPAQGEAQMALYGAAQNIGIMVERTTRVMDVSALYGLLRGAGIFAWLCAAILAGALFGLWKMGGTQRGEWLFGVALCAGIALLIPVAVIHAAGLYDISLQPAQLNMLVTATISAAQTAFVVLSILSFAASGVCLLWIQKPEALHKLRNLIGKGWERIRQGKPGKLETKPENEM